MTRAEWRGLALGMAALMITTIGWAQETAKTEIGTQIVTAGMTAAEFREIAGKVRAMDDGKNCGHRTLEYRQTIRLEELAGGKVKTIRVVRAESFKGAPALKAEEVKAKVEKVWSAKFGWMACTIQWAEPTLWSVEAELVFEDGKKGVSITDGWHVALRDHDGNTWFLR